MKTENKYIHEKCKLNIEIEEDYNKPQKSLKYLQIMK
jgi:hypothetical protein